MCGESVDKKSPHLAEARFGGLNRVIFLIIMILRLGMAHV